MKKIIFCFTIGLSSALMFQSCGNSNSSDTQIKPDSTNSTMSADTMKGRTDSSRGKLDSARESDTAKIK